MAGPADKYYLPGIQNPNNTDTFRRRDTHSREMNNDHVSNAEADADWAYNLKHFNGSRCDDQLAAPNRDNTPPKRR